jgi:hypothetical protein
MDVNTVEMTYRYYIMWLNILSVMVVEKVYCVAVQLWFGMISHNLCPM